MIDHLEVMNQIIVHLIMVNMLLIRWFAMHVVRLSLKTQYIAQNVVVSFGWNVPIVVQLIHLNTKSVVNVEQIEMFTTSKKKQKSKER